MSYLIGKRFPNFFDRGPVQDFKFFRDPPYKNIYLQNKSYFFIKIKIQVICLFILCTKIAR